MNKRKNIFEEVQVLKEICKNKKVVIGYLETLYKMGDITETIYKQLIEMI